MARLTPHKFSVGVCEKLVGAAKHTLVGESGAACMSVWSYGSEVNALGRRPDLMEAEASALAVTQLPPRLLRSIAPKAFLLVAAGGAHALAVDTDGALYAWGWNQYGQCGLGAESVGSTELLPRAVPFLQMRRAVQAYPHVQTMSGTAGPGGCLAEARGRLAVGWGQLACFSRRSRAALRTPW